MPRKPKFLDDKTVKFDEEVTEPGHHPMHDEVTAPRPIGTSGPDEETVDQATPGTDSVTDVSAEGGDDPLTPKDPS
jgi:hypothetical protein